MAINLAERAVDAAKDLFQNQLPAVLTTINTEHSDGITVPAPEAYYIHHIAQSKHNVYMTFSATSALDMRNPNAGTAKRLQSDVNIRIEVVLINRQNYSHETMHRIMMRYGAAVARVLVQYPTLNVSGNNIQWTSTVDMDYSDDTIEENGQTHLLNKLECNMTVSLYEIL